MHPKSSAVSGLPQAHSQSSDHNNQVSLTIFEYEEIAQRLEESHKLLDLISDAISTVENLEILRPQIEQKCNRMTMRLRVVKIQGR
jgi:hypothetical protein